MIINKPHLCTRIDIWTPRYKDKYGELETPVVLLAKYRVHHASPTIIVNFTKAKHLLGQRFAITRVKAESFPLDSNGKIECYAVPLNAFEPWESGAEVLEEIDNIKWGEESGGET